jgi:hypothetical protein
VVLLLPPLFSSSPPSVVGLGSESQRVLVRVDLDFVSSNRCLLHFASSSVFFWPTTLSEASARCQPGGAN